MKTTITDTGVRKDDNGGNPQTVVIAPPNMQVAKFLIRGIAPLVMHRFGEKAAKQMHDQQVAGEQSKKNRKRVAKQFMELYEEAKHITREGWCGIPASAFRSAMISACRTVGFTMTLAKLCIYCIEDGYDKADGTGLVKITKGEPEYFEAPVRLPDGSIDLRARPRWSPGWEAVVTLKWDADKFSAQDVTNLLARVGAQVGVMEGRPDSKKSAGCGWGLFEVVAS